MNKNITTISLRGWLITVLLLLLVCQQAHADTLRIAVASNFAHTLHTLLERFENATGHETITSSASTGKLYAQIDHGAPIDIFLAADEARPDRLVAEGKAVAGMSRSYAIGKLVLLSNIKPGGDCKQVLHSRSLEHLAIANPATAPYGAAARQVLQNIGLWKTLQPRLVTAENITQTLQFVTTGNADAGFVARSLLMQGADINSACEWDVPASLYSPVRQKMVVLSRAASNPAAKDFWAFMQSNEARQIINSNGYDAL